MTSLGNSVSAAGADHQITAMEARQLVQESGGHGNLVHALQEQGVGELEAENLANRIEVAAHDQAPGPVLAVNFGTPTSAAETVSFTANPATRAALIRQSPQVNPISQAQGVGNECCGGASVTNALILTSTTPAEARANAQAVGATAAALGSRLKPPMTAEESAALAKFERGQASPADVQRLQVLLYRMGQALAPGAKGGMNDGTMGTLVTMLRERGAFGNHTVTFHGGKQPNGGDHWTTSVDGVHANSADGAGASVQSPPPAYTQHQNARWTAEVTSTPTATNVLTYCKGTPEAAFSYGIHPHSPPQQPDTAIQAMVAAYDGAQVVER